MKKIKVVTMLMSIIIITIITACSASPKLEGAWIAEENLNGYPYQMQLNDDGTAIVDGISANWSTQENTIIFSWMLGTHEYEYHFEGSNLYLDDVMFSRRK